MEYFKVNLPKEQSSIIKVMGVGGGGSNAVNYMYEKGIVGVDFFLCNTDAQHLERSNIPTKIQLGSNLTEGLGAGGDPEFGKRCALESLDRIEESLRNNTKMLFITAGMGGGTGTGAAPVIAQKARQMGILTIGIVTRPFKNEGPLKSERAEKGIDDLKPHVDALLIINNDRILQMYSNLRITEALSKADDILFTASRGIAEIITKKGFMNVDFRDVKTAMENSGRAIMGTGLASGDDRAILAAQQALDSPLLDDNSIEGAKHILVNISYGADEPYTSEIDLITGFFQQQAGQNANLKFGFIQDENLGRDLAITLVATGFDNSINPAQKVNNNIEDNSEIIALNLDNPDTITFDIPEDNITQEEIQLNNPTQSTTKPNNRFKDPNGNKEEPAFKRFGIQFEELKKDVEISEYKLEEDKENKNLRFKEGGNKYLHDNVD